MDGDLAPLRDIAYLASKYGALLMVDEAHATGIFGETGSGLVEALGLRGQVHVQMGTFSKTLGSLGGYVAGSKELIDYLLQHAAEFYLHDRSAARRARCIQSCIAGRTKRAGAARIALA